MMSDDALVVLVTKNPSDDEVSDYEYRVSYTDNLEKLYGIFDPDTGKWAGDNSIILDLFSEKTVYTDLDDCRDEGTRIRYHDHARLPDQVFLRAINRSGANRSHSYYEVFNERSYYVPDQ